jgi:hypothetical protein
MILILYTILRYSKQIYRNMSEFYPSYYSNLAEEEIAKQFQTERREMIFCAIPMTKKWPFGNQILNPEDNFCQRPYAMLKAPVPSITVVKQH